MVEKKKKINIKKKPKRKEPEKVEKRGFGLKGYHRRCKDAIRRLEAQNVFMIRDFGKLKKPKREELVAEILDRRVKEHQKL